MNSVLFVNSSLIEILPQEFSPQHQQLLYPDCAERIQSSTSTATLSERMQKEFSILHQQLLYPDCAMCHEQRGLSTQHRQTLQIMPKEFSPIYIGSCDQNCRTKDHFSRLQILPQSMIILSDGQLGTTVQALSIFSITFCFFFSMSLMLFK